jgi:hypothetical protein
MPVVSDLRQLLSSPLKHKVPVSDEYYSDSLKEFVVLNPDLRGGSLSLAFHNVISGSCLEQSSMNSEDSFHSQHDKIIHAFVKEIKKHLPQPKIDDCRNVRDPLSHASPTETDSRPDYLC